MIERDLLRVAYRSCKNIGHGPRSRIMAYASSSPHSFHERHHHNLNTESSSLNCTRLRSLSHPGPPPRTQLEHLTQRRLINRECEEKFNLQDASDLPIDIVRALLASTPEQTIHQLSVYARTATHGDNAVCYGSEHGFKNDTGNVLGSILQPPGFQLQLIMSSCSSKRKQRPNMYRAGARGGGKPCTGDWPQHVPFSSGSASHTVGNEETVITSIKFISESSFQRGKYPGGRRRSCPQTGSRQPLRHGAAEWP